MQDITKTGIKDFVKHYLPPFLTRYIRLFKRIVLLDALKELAAPGHLKNNSSWCLYMLLTGKIHLICSAYFSGVIKWKQIDWTVIEELNNTIPASIEGCLLDCYDDLRVRTQVNFLARILQETSAKRVLETGTHKAMFCYLVHLCDHTISIETFGNLPESQQAVDLLNHKYGQFVQFHFGDSRETLNRYATGVPFDFAWIDGGHTYEVCMSDLVNCARLRIPAIAVDDYRSLYDVQQAVREFSQRFDYQIIRVSDAADYRGIAYLRKQDTREIKKARQ